jgi:hypothetical protein
MQKRIMYNQIESYFYSYFNYFMIVYYMHNIFYNNLLYL